MGEISLNSALEAIQSTRVKDRTDGLDDLKHILSQNRQSSKLSELNDKGYQSLFQTLFKVALNEKASYAKTTKISKSQAESRLSTCAKVLRLAVEVGVRVFRYKTNVRALIDHITQTLPYSEDHYCKPLVGDYIKALRTILEYRCHPEHLSKEEWHTLVNFCHDGIQYTLSLTDNDTNSSNLQDGHIHLPDDSSGSAAPSTMGSSLGHARRIRGRLSSTTDFTKTTEDLALCLFQLLSTSNAPTLAWSPLIVTGLLTMLGTTVSVGSQHAAFQCINTILSTSITDAVDLAQQTLSNVIPYLRRLWQIKSAGLRDEILITVITGESLLSGLLQNAVYEDTRSELQGLYHVLLEEYAKRPERDLLQIDELDLVVTSTTETENSALSMRLFNLRPRLTKSEQAWALLHVVSTIWSALQEPPVPVPRSYNPEDSETPRKRRRIASQFDTLLHPLQSSPSQDKIVTLQLLTFIIGRIELNEVQILAAFGAVAPLLSSDDSAISNWSMLAMSCVASQKLALSEDFYKTWLQIWQIGARGISSIGTTRNACHLIAVLLDNSLVKYADIADTIENILSSVDLNGPALFSTSAVALWIDLVALKATHSPVAIQDIAERVLRWTFIRWKPSQIQDRSQVVHLSQHCQSSSIVRLISYMLGISQTRNERVSPEVFGPVGQAMLRCKFKKDLVKYLVLATDTTTDSSARNTAPSDTVSIQLPDNRSQNLCGIAMDSLNAEINALLKQKLFSDVSVSPTMSVDIAQIVCSLCVVAFSVASEARIRDTNKARILWSGASELRDRLAQLVLRQENPLTVADGILASLGSLLSPANSLSRNSSGVSEGARTTATVFDYKFWQQARSSDCCDNLGTDYLEVDENFESQYSTNIRKENTVREIEHDWLCAATDLAAYRACLTARICEASITHTEDVNENYQLHTKQVEYLTNLQPHDFLSCRPYLNELFELGILIGDSEALMILEYLGNSILSSYEFERSEVSLGTCLDIMTSLAYLWTDSERLELADLGSSLYEWFIKVMDRGLLAPHVHNCMSSMLQRVIKVKPEYGRKLELPSARTTLFRILEEGPATVKYFVGQNISSIFGFFVLKEHEAILDDIISSLPTIRDWKEGIALRLYILAYLGRSWSTLLRKCVYAMFETAGQVSGSGMHARCCMEFVSNTLKLPDSKSLFKLFASQIIFTWLETQPLADIPFSIFRYSSIADLLVDVQSEVTGQVVMRGRDEEAVQLAAALSIPFEQLVETSFSKCAAYCIARDAAVSPTRDTQAADADARLRRILGKDRYGTLITQNFPEIMATLFKATDREEHITKGFQKHDGYAVAQEAYDEIIFFGSSTLSLPSSQQPSFKAGYLVDEIIYLFSRSAYDFETIWPAALYVYVFRELLNTINKAIGSLYACSVIRRVRILVCIARGTALREYALEMALHSLRPFLTDTQCAEDAMGVSRYLLVHGASYLQEVPSFLAGYAVSTLVSMKKFLEVPQESTTQESQYRATLNKAQEFHSWLGTFADSYSSPLLIGPTELAFKNMILSARQLGLIGNGRKGTYESDLLLELLKDRFSGGKLINANAQDSILDLLCSEFEVPANCHEDILGSDEDAITYVSSLWSSCTRCLHGSRYLLWVARVLGRAYAGTGAVDKDMLREIKHQETTTDETTSSQTLESGSRNAILSKLLKILHTDRPEDIGVVERTLQMIVTNSEGTNLSTECEQSLPAQLIKAMTWTPFHCPAIRDLGPTDTCQLSGALIIESTLPLNIWARQTCIALVNLVPSDVLLSELRPILFAVSGAPERLFPYVLHLVLLEEFAREQNIKQMVSSALGAWCRDVKEATMPHIKLLFQTVLYLRSQPLPHEQTKSERSRWLDLDYEQAAVAATRCKMYKTALLFLEVGYSEVMKTKKLRRSSGIKLVVPTDLLLEIFQNLDEKDSFHGIQQPSSLSSMMDELEYENAGFKGFSFRAAHFDSQIRQLHGPGQGTEEGMIKTLDSLDLNGLSQSLISTMVGSATVSAEAMLRTARKLERWDISTPPAQASEASTLFRVFQDLNRASDYKSITSAVDRGFSEAMVSLFDATSANRSVHSMLSCLAVLSEIEDVITSQGIDQLQETWEKFCSRTQWMYTESLDHISTITSCRQTLFSTLSQSNRLQHLTRTSQRDARRIECQALLSSTALSRHHGALQSSLATATYLGQIVELCSVQGVKVDVAARLEEANVLWDQQEMSASIRMLQDIVRGANLHAQDIRVGRPELLAKLGHRISEARLEKPDEIITNYLLPAIRELHGLSEGPEAGQVFHEFAAFCDQQLQNNDNLEDFRRIGTLRERKEAEVHDLARMIKAAGSQSKEKGNLESHQKKAKLWFELDDREFQRLKASREAFLSRSLENYLLSLKACDKYDNDALRFSALWLEHADNDIANSAVSKNISHVGSRKFAPLMNQWTSRLLDATNSFQTLLSAMVYRICLDHPYHGMYQVFASSKTKGGKDQAALARNAAAVKIVNQLKGNKRAGPVWLAVHNSNINFVRFAAEKLDEGKAKPGTRILLRRSATGAKLEQDIPHLQIPPPTMKLALRHDCDYSATPSIVKFQSEFTVASGISMPKILTAVASDGRKYKQLFKGGNDDLRQDSIMEQVFEQVSNLLKTQRDTRQRNLGIRTYKVVPLTATSGLVEFVSDTVPLHEYLMPAHQRHFPGDFKPNVCRKHILDVQNKTVDIRVKTFTAVCDRFHPVMRYFFMERFENPDDWFEKRLAYTRSTAAISILGYILGLGDRHGHNILLDEKTGEVVHIDLGIAFEQGRVLPVPEVVPFRLTRDLVDGMGITRTEGVFRRCCEFTMAALRNESYSIMTILDVLRYDPLYSWSLSPLRLKKLQDNQANIASSTKPVDEEMAKNEKPDNEPGEADRALTVVSKKLSKSLSVTATVNELIQQATDEKNLGLLFCGWAAYA